MSRRIAADLDSSSSCSGRPRCWAWHIRLRTATTVEPQPTIFLVLSADEQHATHDQYTETNVSVTAQCSLQTLVPHLCTYILSISAPVAILEVSDNGNGQAKVTPPLLVFHSWHFVSVRIVQMIILPIVSVCQELLTGLARDSQTVLDHVYHGALASTLAHLPCYLPLRFAPSPKEDCEGKNCHACCTGRVSVVAVSVVAENQKTNNLQSSGPSHVAPTYKTESPSLSTTTRRLIRVDLTHPTMLAVFLCKFLLNKSRVVVVILKRTEFRPQYFTEYSRMPVVAPLVGIQLGRLPTS